MPRAKTKPPHRFRPPHGSSGKPGRPTESDRVLLYGLHAVEAALANPNRTIGRLVGSDAVHQGVLLETTPLPRVELEGLRADGILLVLDQITDPQNVGAVLRSAAAFGAVGVVMPERHSPPLTGALAKAASAGLDIVPVILVANLAQALGRLGDAGFLRVGLAEEGAEALEAAELSLPLALVLGAEGKGLRQLTRGTCDRLCRISTTGRLASLNISNAAVIALHWASATAKPR